MKMGDFYCSAKWYRKLTQFEYDVCVCVVFIEKQLNETCILKKREEEEEEEYAEKKYTHILLFDKMFA